MRQHFKLSSRAASILLAKFLKFERSADRRGALCLADFRESLCRPASIGKSRRYAVFDTVVSTTLRGSPAH